MSDPIDRQAAIDAMMKLQTEDIEAYGASIPEGFDGDRAVTALKALPSAQQWISCEERLPEAYVDVLVWFEYFRYGAYNRLYQTYGIGDYSSEFYSWMINHESGWSKLRVIAWMPLPDPWEGENNGI